MDSVQLGFFAVDQLQLFREAIRVTRSGGFVVFSSYTSQFWEDRLEWFEIQSAQHLIGEIDYQATGNGMIVCKDGFRATTADRATFERLAVRLAVTPRITEVDGSSSKNFRRHPPVRCPVGRSVGLRLRRRRH
jgi:hypothetical protein